MSDDNSDIFFITPRMRDNSEFFFITLSASDYKGESLNHKWFTDEKIPEVGTSVQLILVKNEDNTLYFKLKVA